MRELLGRLLGFEEKFEEMDAAFTEFEQFIFNEAKFPDSMGKIDNGHDYVEVAEKWSEFHRLVIQFNKAARLVPKTRLPTGAPQRKSA